MNHNNTKTTYQYFKPGDLRGLECYLNAMSGQDWQCLRPGRLRQVFAQGEGGFVHRFGYCDAPEGSADEITYTSACELAGWTAAGRSKGWILWRKPASEAAEDEKLPDHRDPIRRLFDRRIARMESLRRVFLILGSALLILGYVSSLLPVMYSCVLPLALVIPITYRIKFLTEGVER